VRRINSVVVLSDAMVGCDGCRQAKNALFGDVVCEQVCKSAEIEGEGERECSRGSPFACDTKLQPAAREGRNEEKKAETEKGRCEYMMRISLV
jgi:hypothetical protein